MDSSEVRSRFLKFFEARGHKIVPSSSLVPENDPSVLFTIAGMQQFKSYYTAPENALKDFGTKNVTTSQKCIRTGDINEVGDDTHVTFLEMLGNFSFGGYWKKEAIQYGYDFITKELGLEIDYVSIFRDDESGIPADEESRAIWQGIDPNIKIREHKREDNFWGPTGEEGPCGPTTEIYINGVEIWNIVFNEFYKTREGAYKPLEVKGIDTGMGLERLLVQAQKKKNIYETDLFLGEQTKEEKIVADHLRAALFIITDGIRPSNEGRGYVLRRLIRRAVRFSKIPLQVIVERIKAKYIGIYDLDDKGEIEKEAAKFRETLGRGMREFEKGTDPFILFSTYGFPIELTEELAKERGTVVDREEFDKKMAEHQKLSQTSSAGMFKGGLANHNEKTIKLHTAHHLLLAGLQNIVDKNIKQRGSNITEERLRMDFLCDHKLADEEKKKVEDWVNEKIKMRLEVIRREMSLIEAKKLGAEMEFGAKYPEIVSLYFIEDKNGNPISKEFCGGPHVKNTGELGQFKIQKEEAVSAGIRRVKAVLW
ncbi:MAG: alanine--tRNA ligase-related protein [Patescibacteria group bacterium]